MKLQSSPPSPLPYSLYLYKSSVVATHQKVGNQLWVGETPDSNSGLLDISLVCSIEPPFLPFFLFFFLALSLPWDWSSTNLGEILHIGCPSIATWIFNFGGAGPGFEPRTALQQSGVGRANKRAVRPPPPKKKRWKLPIKSVDS